MPALPKVLIVDGFDMSTIGLICDNQIRGFEDGPTIQWTDIAPYGRFGNFVMASEPNYQPRVLIVPSHVLGTNRAAMEANLDEIKYRLFKHTVVVRFAHDETREYNVRVDQGTVTPVAPAMTQRGMAMSIRLVARDPRKFATSDTVQGFSGATAMVLGTAPSHPVIRLTGGTNPILIYKDSSAVEQGRMELTWSGTWIDIDMDLKTIIDNASANQAAALTAGDFFALDPQQHGDYVTPAWPTLQVSSSSGQATYRKAYW